MGRPPLLRPDGTISPTAYTVTDSGCHIWRHLVVRGYPVLFVNGRHVRVRNWLIGVPSRCRADATCGDKRCINPDHLTRHIPKPAPPTLRPAIPKPVDHARQRALTEIELAKPVGDLRTLRHVREDIARLLTLVPDGVISGRDRDGLTAYAGGASYRVICEGQGVSKQRIEQRLREADRRLRLALCTPDT